MKRVFLILSLTVAAFGCHAQNAKLDASGNYVAISKVDTTYIASGKTYTDQKGAVYPVFIAKSGMPFVNKTSKEGKKYRYYLKVK